METLKWLMLTLLFGWLTVGTIRDARRSDPPLFKLQLILEWLIVIQGTVSCILCAVAAVISILGQLN